MSGERAVPTRATRAADLVGRALIVWVFSFGAFKKAHAVLHAHDLWSAGADPYASLRMLSELANLTFLLLVIGITLFRLPPLKSAEGIEARLVALAGTFATGLLVMIPPTMHLTPALRVVALCFTFAGFGLAAGVLVWLGRSFSITAEARRLVVTGPYAIVRHPLYVVEEIAVFGIFLQHVSLLAVLFLVVQWSLQLRRMHHEERVLRQTFPEYEAYAKVTPRVLPFASGDAAEAEG